MLTEVIRAPSPPLLSCLRYAGQSGAEAWRGLRGLQSGGVGPWWAGRADYLPQGQGAAVEGKGILMPAGRMQIAGERNGTAWRESASGAAWPSGMAPDGGGWRRMAADGLEWSAQAMHCCCYGCACRKLAWRRGGCKAEAGGRAGKA